MTTDDIFISVLIASVSFLVTIAIAIGLWYLWRQFIRLRTVVHAIQVANDQQVTPVLVVRDFDSV